MKMITIIISAFILSSCATTAKKERNKLTKDNIEKNVVKNMTTKVQVIEEFGAPQMVNSDSSKNEQWVYSQTYTGRDSSSFAAGGLGLVSMAILGIGGEIESEETSRKTLTLTINFDKKDKVKDYKLSTSSL